MEQITLFLQFIRKNADLSLITVTMVQLDMVHTTIETKMSAYMVAKDMINWMKNPQSSADNPVYGWSNCQPLLEKFEAAAKELEKQICAGKGALEEYVAKFDSNLILQQGNQPKWFHDALQYAANLFEKTVGDRGFNKVLELNEETIRSWENTDQPIGENLRLIYRSLRYAAMILDSKQGYGKTTQLLDEKKVPQMNELGE